MSNCNDVTSAQLCYIPCNFCNITLAVSVPCSSLFDMVTVRCGHCSNLWSVNMAAALQSLSWKEQLQAQNLSSADYRTTDLASSSSSKRNNKVPNQATNSHSEERIITRPPEKRQRVPSAYNQFIKEEIQRIKANNPDINHKEAFSTAAKNGSSGKHLLKKTGILNK